MSSPGRALSSRALRCSSAATGRAAPAAKHARAAYTAAKSGLVGLTKALSNEWASKGVNVNAIAPGYIATDNTQALYDDPDRHRSILERIPAGRWGEGADLAGATVFLASAASDYVNGIVLPVDGGWLGR